MSSLKIDTNPDVKTVFKKYPPDIRKLMISLRKLIIETANETDHVDKIEETLKWGEPSYITKHGSTIRIDWKEKNPDQYAIYFKCTSKLVPVFKEVFGETFNYEGTRAIIFAMDDVVPETELKSCIKAALTYHKVKHMPLLGL